ncbi:MAG: LPS export ABC transporter periplasmic protein LptC [Spirochaetes bacterium RBG_13_68_11]|nr:MAG: LPS export ABC transporter periplasmic protein LptC [Spirochaetes bacterium RBG_13_68_11]
MPRSKAIAARAARTSTAVAAIAAAMAAAALSASVLSSCSLDYEGARLEDQLPERLPDTVATGLVHRVVKNSRTALEVTAERAETWDAQHRTVLDGASFVEYDQVGAMTVEGSAGRVVFHTDTEDAEISGRVRVHSAVEEAGIETEALTWKNKPRLLAAPEHDRVVITKDDGSRLEGTGFVGDFRRREFVFTGPVQGTYVWTGKEEDE